MKTHRRRDDRTASVSRLVAAASTFGAAMLLGGLGYWVIGGGRWTFGECVYMAIVTLSTVGFSETLDGMNEIPYARMWTVTLILLGSGTLLYFASTLTAIIVEGDLQGFFRRNRMKAELEKVKDHVIVCGVGATGLHVALELAQTGTPFVVIDRNEAKILRLAEEIGEFLFVVGSATEDHALEEAGITRARGVIAALTEDRDNLFVTITARALNENLRIVSKCVSDDSAAKLRRAGADVVVSPSLIGGMRMVSEMVRPTVVQFLDTMLRDRSANRRIEEVAIPEGSAIAGKNLAGANFRRFGDTLVVAIRHPDGTHVYNPPADHALTSGQVLIVMARSDQLSDLRKYVATRTA